MKFHRYNSIENVTHAKTMAQIELHDFQETNWVVTEKIHGANSSIWTDGNEVKFAKRTGFIGESENFYSHQKIFPVLKEKILKVFKYLQENDSSILEVVVFGELFGGGFSHPDVKNIDVKQIQKGIFYSPDIEFGAFDITINGKIVMYSRFKALAAIGDFFTVPFLFKGSLEKCLEHSNAFDSLVPAALGYPHLEDNICEGVVIKPSSPLFFGNGSRVILKNRNEKWVEKSKAKKSIKTPTTLSAAGKEKVNTMNQYITENRLHNVISKFGEVTQKDFGKILGLMMKDVIEDYEKEHESPEFEHDEDKLIKKLVSQEISNLIRPNFKNMIDGYF